MGSCSSANRGIFLGIPLFAGKLIPVRMRMAFGLILSLLINPLVPADLNWQNILLGQFFCDERGLHRIDASNDGADGLFRS